MNLTIFTSPNPNANLSELFRRIPFGNRSACIVVPDFRSSISMEKNILKLSGGAYVGHRVFTIEGLSRAILSLSGNVPETISNHLKHALLAEIVKSRIKNQSRYLKFHGIRDL